MVKQLLYIDSVVRIFLQTFVQKVTTFSWHKDIAGDTYLIFDDFD